MKKEEISQIVKAQRDFFASGKTLDIKHRLSALSHLKKTIREKEDAIGKAIRSDLGKSAFESYMCEIGLALDEASYMLRNVKKFSKEKRVKTPLPQFASKSFTKPAPLGTVLIMSPWNYPFLLTITPLIDALAAGNTAVVKPSAYSPATSKIISEIIAEVFPPEYVTVITGGREENACLLDEKFDFIFFTGSKNVGKEVLAKAANSLTPTVLELGGKSPCIVDKSANLPLAAKRIVFGKYLNCGQTCVAPDYILCEKSVKDEFIKCVKSEIDAQYGKDVLNSDTYGKIVNRKHFDRILSLIDKNKVVHGGKSDGNFLKIEPTVMDNVTFDDAVMKEEIFGPVMPILTYKDTDEVINIVNRGEKPLALYVFTSDKKMSKRIISSCTFGGGCINDVVIHLATPHMGFGGVGESGMGAYHGRVGFEAFSHRKSIVDKKTWIDLPMRYQPYKKINEKLLHMFLK